MMNIPPYHPRHKRKKLIPVVSNLSLVSAVYSINDALVTVTFNRAIDVDNLNAAELWINDGLYSNQKLQGYSYSSVDSTTVQISFEQVDPFTGSETTLDADADNGIIAAGDGASWAGVTGYVLTIG